MGAAMGRETDAVALFAALAEAPHRHDFYQTLRRLECLFDDEAAMGARSQAGRRSPCASARNRISRSRRRRWRRSSRAVKAAVRGFRCVCSGCLVPNGRCRCTSRSTRASDCVSRRSDARPVPRSLPSPLPGAVLSRVGAGAAPRQPRSSGRRPVRRRTLAAFIGLAPARVSRSRRGARPREVLSRRRAGPPDAERRGAARDPPALLPRARSHRGVRRTTGWCSTTARTDVPGS